MELCSKPLSVNKLLIAFREQYADEIQDLKVQENYQIFTEAFQQMKKMLQGMENSLVIIWEILPGLGRTQMILLSCTTVLTGQDLFTMANGFKSREWTEKDKAYFSRKFTSFVPGAWDRRDILDNWEELAKVS